DEIYHFLSDAGSDNQLMGADAIWKKLVIVFDTQSHYGDNTIGVSQLLILNSWGELFFRRLDLSQLDSDQSKCAYFAKESGDIIRRIEIDATTCLIRHLRLHTDEKCVMFQKAMIQYQNKLKLNPDEETPIQPVDEHNEKNNTTPAINPLQEELNELVYRPYLDLI
ncbi:MAG: hypothetical protein HQK77_16680, partial [Desulfobacterales bacterium]|nr:hypothetical protein [Desulfobacterales bacterium]